MAGWVLSAAYSYEQIGLLPLLLPSLAVDAYYAVTAEGITTVAHLCAVLLGAGLHRCHRWYGRRRVDSVFNKDEAQSLTQSSDQG